MQRNWYREKQFKPKPNTDSKKSDGKKSCVWCKEDVHSVTSFQLRMQFVNSVAKRDILNGHMRQEEKRNTQRQELQAPKCCRHRMWSGKQQIWQWRRPKCCLKSYVFECLPHWCFMQNMGAVKLRSQARLTPVLWYPACQSRCFRRLGYPRMTWSLAMPSSAVYPEQKCGTVDIKVTCNNITAMTRFYVTKQ